MHLFLLCVHTGWPTQALILVRLQNKLRVDTGAIKFVLQGANIMCPGLTSPGATIHTEVQRLTLTAVSWCCQGLKGNCEASCVPRLEPTGQPAPSLRKWGRWQVSGDLLRRMQVDADAPVAIYAEGKEHAMAVGVTKMSTKDMREINKGIGVDNLHFLTDGLWRLSRVD
jgi:predicted ribosome-associated RNA-binding protein Tma20